MKGMRMLISGLAVGLALALAIGAGQAQPPAPQAQAAPLAPLGSAFTYQGQLRRSGEPVSGDCAMAFRLYDAAEGGAQVSSPLTPTAPVSNSLFTVQLDFGASAFAGEARWLGIRVQCPGDDTYADLGRQALTAAPHALYALGAPWAGLNGVPDGFADGVDDASIVVSGTQVYAGEGLTQLASGDAVTLSLISTYRLPQTCGNGQIAEWNGAAWVCGDDDVGGGSGDHDHLGQTWVGSDNPLVMTGTFGAPDYAGLVLGNSAAAGAGLRVVSATNGVYVESAGGDGVYVHRAGSPTTTISSFNTNGFEVAGAAGYGLRVGRSDLSGVSVVSAGWNGVQVDSAGFDGVWVDSAGDDGFYVNRAGDPSMTSPSTNKNGFEVAGAEDSGLWVGHADLDGVTVHSADWYGVYVEQADSDGVRVQSAGGNGVVGISVNATYYGGLFRNDVAGGAGLYAAGGDNAAPDLVLGVYGSGDDGRIYSYPEMTGSDILLFSNDETHVHLDEDANSDSAFVIYNGANTAVFSVNEAGMVTFAGASTTQVEAGAYGPRTVYAVQATGNWYEDFGAAQLVNGQATVMIEPIFAQTVNLSEYHVFLTPLGDCPLYVAEKTASAFTVKAMGGQTCRIAFDYRIVARRLGYETLRLEAATPVEMGGEE